MQVLHVPSMRSTFIRLQESFKCMVELSFCLLSTYNSYISKQKSKKATQNTKQPKTDQEPYLDCPGKRRNTNERNVASAGVFLSPGGSSFLISLHGPSCWVRVVEVASWLWGKGIISLFYYHNE